ncbi:MAG: hypothetical protein LH702_11205 [Phormidesmis sp. CAN_BIN44]|nr:hypothetical protein [Phormidesmis sp. CAN_BIN44]
MKKMAVITTLDSSYEFIELHRTFHELSERSSENDDVAISRAFHVGGRLRWSDLLKEYRLILLSEAGSGKTAEIRNIASTLRAQGKHAFFLRLEHISRDFEESFEVGTCQAFEAWLASGEEGWLLLDSVDEARLRHPGDFELAIRKLGRRISTAKDRTHIFITGRTTAWRPNTDLASCTAHLPYAVAATSERDPQIKDDDPNGSLRTETETQDKTKPVFKIVALDDLTPHQIAVFSNAQGIQDSKAFLDSVERADAWSFTSRPQDLEELTEFWIDKGCIGSRLELMQNSIDRRLAERDQGRADVCPLSAERARLGARLLAATTTLAKEPTIRVPDGAKNAKGIAVKSVLSDWDDKEQSILLSRPIFDEAIYGTVRFHHRSVREYLTAEWFAELLKCETSRRTIEGLFFRNQYGLDIVVPTLRPILPWLAILDEKIRERVRRIAPEIIFEGGDPSQLPLEVRRYILHEVCKQIASGATGRSMQDYASVQRFANLDLTDDVRSLIRQYAGNEDLAAFLLRMVWLGQIAGALPEAMDIVLTPTTAKYTRLTAFRAIKAIGSTEDQAQVRQSFLTEASELKRAWLAELLEGVQPTEQTLVWLLACLEKSESKETYTVDRLADGVLEFVSTADIELLPQFVTGLNRLLSLPPMLERRYCEVSEKFQWLIAPASKAVEQLILSRHSAAIEPDALAILHKFSVARGYGSNDMINVKDEFSKLVPAWQELNRALFWFEVQSSRKTVDRKHEGRLTSFQQVSIFGWFWQFEEGDFEYVAEEISRQTLLDDKLVALSLAFNLYKMATRPRPWRIKLKKFVAGNDELSKQLDNDLKPSAESEDSRRLRQQPAAWKRRDKAKRKKQEKKQEEYHADWKSYLNGNLEEVRAALCEKPGTMTNSLLYLFKQLRAKEHVSGRWTEYNWKTLIPEYGEEVARFYRDSTVSFWRHHEPKLRSEGAPFNETTHAAIIGLTGLEIEAHETKGWPKNLNTVEVERACKYASFELNGFPTWFPKLFETYPKIVCDFLMREVQYELSIENPETETHYILSDVSWLGQWAWDEIAPSIYDFLKTREPTNVSNLDKLLKILQGSTLADDLVEELASRKCCVLEELDHVAHWFAVWTGVAPEAAIASLEAQIGMVADPKQQTLFAMTFVTHLWGGHRVDRIVARQAFKTPKYLKALYLLMHEYIRGQEDINHAETGCYSPDLRDDAQNARDNLFSLLSKIPGKKSFLALNDIAKAHPGKASQPWILLHAKTRAEQDSDIEPWSPLQVRDFHEKLERTPSNHRELAELAVMRLLDLKDDLEHGDSSVAGILQTVTQETDMRKYIGRELREKALRRYSIPQEEELADAKRPDLRLHGVGFDGPVPVELKLAWKWSGPQLFERLKNQLCGDYLRDNHSNRGIFLLVYRRGGKDHWELPSSGDLEDFAGLTAALQDYWWQISPQFANVDDITVIGIDLTKRSS